ncbi:vesicle-associated membrane protein 725-like [Brassica rapa]|uniref:vesicle-associated membrane protein 725-like n=1 Tax=Brassica campestris TaxID=3711 RepID=UPI00142D283A|nr:vesicle-associated membrane protein 725-like [Brassica rapa]
MQYCVDHPEEINKLAKVKAQVTEVKGVMMENIEKVRIVLSMLISQLCFIINLSIFVITGLNLYFRTQGTKIRRKMWWENMKIKLIVVGIIIALILIIIISVCPGFKCT